MPNVHLFVRRDAGAGGKLSKSTIIIIAIAAGSVVILILALFAWRLLARSCRRSKVPLPPVQDLAHHREHQLAAFAERNKTLTESELVQPHPRLYSAHFLSASGSSASLIRGSPDSVSRGLSRESSWAMEDTPSTESSPYPLSPDDLVPPNPSFLPSSTSPHISMASVASSSSDGISDVNVALPATPSEHAHSVESSASLIHTPGAHGSPARPRPPRGSRSRSRPMSIISSAGTTHSRQTTQSANTLRGPAHSMHSSIQIVLPAPLAPELYPRADTVRPMDRVGSFYGVPVVDRKSVADQWVNVKSRPASVVRPEREASAGTSGGSRPSSATPRSRPRSHLSNVASTSSLSDGDNARSRTARRSESQPPIPRAPSMPIVARPLRARTPSPGPPNHRASMPAPQPAAVSPVLLPAKFARERGHDHDRGVVDSGNENFFPPQHQQVEQRRERGRTREPIPLPAQAQTPLSTLGGPQGPSGKLRKNRASRS